MTVCLAVNAAQDPNQNKEKPKMADQKATAAPRVELNTSKGIIVIELDPVKAPITTKNFLTYVNEGFYNGTIFHRVIPGFMIQGGGMTADMSEKPTHGTIKNEASNGLKNDRGTIAMARRSDPNSASAQFFINTANNAPLNYRGPNSPGYAVFGKVVEGMAVVDAIEKVKTHNVGPHGDVPVEPVTIVSAKELK
jgi:peptidyl-prolyl cis-trans isomerase B (cyclophilin B)